MNQDEIAAQDVALAYEELFVPALFREWAVRAVGAVRLRPGDRLLDVACGTGIVAREAAARVAPGGEVAGIDAAPGMVAVARRLLPGAEFREGRAESLPWNDGSFDAVVSQFGLMFFEDRVQALREMWRVLRPGGRLAVLVWSTLQDSPAFATEVDLVERIAGERAATALRSIFSLGERSELARLFEAANVGPVEITSSTAPTRFPSIRSMLEADLRGWLPLVGVVLPDPAVERILREGESALAPYVTEEGFRFDAAAHVVKGVK